MENIVVYSDGNFVIHWQESPTETWDYLFIGLRPKWIAAKQFKEGYSVANGAVFPAEIADYVKRFKQDAKNAAQKLKRASRDSSAPYFCMEKVERLERAALLRAQQEKAQKENAQNDNIRILLGRLGTLLLIANLVFGFIR